jgi:hypothetical protein
MSQFGKICSIEYAAKAGLCRRLSRSVNMTASKHPVKAPMNASVIEMLLKVRSPWPLRKNPEYAIATIQRITRTGCTGIISIAKSAQRADMRLGKNVSRQTGLYSSDASLMRRVDNSELRLLKALCWFFHPQTWQAQQGQRVNEYEKCSAPGSRKGEAGRVPG